MRLSWEETAGFLSLFRALLDVVPLTVTIHETGLALARDYQLSLYDAMIAAAAIKSGCDTLFSEDMQNGQAIENRLRIVNPF